MCILQVARRIRHLERTTDPLFRQAACGEEIAR
jgi:hypothetical protein